MDEECRKVEKRINNMQVWRVKQTVLFVADGKVEDAFPLFSALLAHIIDLSSKQSCKNFAR